MITHPAFRRFIFLDYDGVLHHEAVYVHPTKGIYIREQGFTLFEWMPILDELLEAHPDVGIILSTSWAQVKSFSYVERALRARGTRFLVIDEAAHIIRQTRRNHLEKQLDTLKSLANQCGAQMILVGSYDLYQLVSLSAQLARRTHVLHFERYRQDNDTDLRAFQSCVQKFQDALPHLWGQQLVQHTAALLENTLGCVGTLSAVLTRAAMLAQQDKQWTVDALRRALLTEAQRKQILEEIIDGESAINPGLTRTMPRAQKSPVARQNRSVA
jgi:hypothetical protein